MANRDLDLVRLTVALYRDSPRIFNAPTGVAKPSWPTRSRDIVRLAEPMLVATPVTIT